MIRDNIDFCQLDITGKCNLNCVFCRQVNERQIPDKMTLNDWGKVILQLKEMNCKRISLAGGEPLISKHFFNILEIAYREIGMVTVLTNGTLIDSEIAKKLAGYVNFVQVSLDAATPELHDTIRGQSGLWNRAVKGIEELIKAKIPVGVRITIFESNAHEVVPLMEWAHKFGVNSFLSRRVVSSGGGLGVEIISSEKLKSIFQSVVKKAFELDMRIGFGDPFPHLLLSSQRQKEAKDDPKILKGEIIGGCSVSIDAMYIAQDGSVLLCPYLPIFCGDVKQDGAKKIWHTAEAYGLARSIRHNLKGKCGRCEYKFACGGCRANAYYQTGDICGEDTGCWHIT